MTATPVPIPTVARVCARKGSDLRFENGNGNGRGEVIRMAKPTVYCMCHGFPKGSANAKRVHKGKRGVVRYWTGPKYR